jgi:hypothetical protein
MMQVLESGRGELIQTPDLEAFREWNRVHKPRKLMDKLMTEREAISRFVTDGCYIGTELYGTVRCPMSLCREVVRQGKKNLRVCGQGVLELDLWLAGGFHHHTRLPFRPRRAGGGRLAARQRPHQRRFYAGTDGL